MIEKQIGTILLEELDERGISQKEFAAKMSISASSLNKYLLNKRQIPIDLLIKFANELDISLDECLGIGNSENLTKLTKKEKNLILKLRQINSSRRDLILKCFLILLDQIKKN